MLKLGLIGSLNWLQGIFVVDHEWLVLDSIVAHQKLAVVDDHGNSLETLAVGVHGIDLLPVAQGPFDGPSQPTKLAVIVEEIFVRRKRIVRKHHLSRDILAIKQCHLVLQCRGLEDKVLILDLRLWLLEPLGFAEEWLEFVGDVKLELLLEVAGH